MKALIFAGLLLAMGAQAASAHACYFAPGFGWVCANLPFYLDPNPPRYGEEYRHGFRSWGPEGRERYREEHRYDDRRYWERR